MSIENIGWSLLAILAIVYLVVGIFFIQWRKKVLQQFTDLSIGNQITDLVKNKKIHGRLALGVLFILLITIVLMNPLGANQPKKVELKGTDVIFCLDLSQSMDAEDVAPNRLLKSKKIIRDILSQMGGDRVGLVFFALDAYRMSPLTTDYNAINQRINMAETSMLGVQGTNLSAALLKGKELLEDENRNGVIVLISDGEDHEEQLDDAIDAIDDAKITVISIGVGTKKGERIPIKNDGDFIEYKVDFDGQDIITQLKDGALKLIANETDGEYLLAENNQTTVDKTLKIINQQQKSSKKSKQIAQPASWYHWFLLPAFLLLFIEFLTYRMHTNK